MIAVIVSPAARADLTEITAYLASVTSVGTASRWNDRLWLAFDEIAEFPGSGALRTKTWHQRPHQDRDTIHRDL